tara:strand:+ start:11884 stop:12918 length:1035 start_codon:yes stop_codon:yes gene_type:complete
MGLWNTIKKAARSVGKFVKKNWKVIVGVAAAVAIPFAAPLIGGALAGSAFLSSVAPSVAGFLGTAGGSALIGAGLGAGAAGITGQNPLLGAALGGIGGYAGAGGLSGLFGGIGGGAAAPAAPLGAGAIVPATGGIIDIGAATGINAATGLVAPVTTAAAGGLSGTLSSLATKLATNPQSIGALGQLAMTMFNKDLNELTPEEKAQLQEVASQAATNRALFEQQVTEANRLINMGTPNPEQAYANARYAADTQLQEARRGMPAGLQEVAARKAAIAGTQAGLQNVALDYAQAADVRRAGVQMLPNEAPTGYNQLAMPTYSSLYERQQKLAEQQNKAVGNLFGSLA